MIPANLANGTEIVCVYDGPIFFKAFLGIYASQGKPCGLKAGQIYTVAGYSAPESLKTQDADVGVLLIECVNERNPMWGFNRRRFRLLEKGVTELEKLLDAPLDPSEIDKIKEEEEELEKA
jgi:hypothetical protein